MYDNPNGNDYSASGTISFKYNSSERVVFWKQYGFGELNGNRRNGALYLCMEQQHIARRPIKLSCRNIYSNSNGRERLYGTNECNDYATASGIGVEYHASERVVFWKQHGFDQLNGNRGHGPIYVCVEQQHNAGRPEQLGCRKLHGNGNGRKWVYCDHDGHDYAASKRGIGECTSTEHLMFERNGQRKFHAKRRGFTLYLCMDQQCYDPKHHEFTSGQLYSYGSRCERLYGECHRYGCRNVKPSSGTDIKFNRNDGANVYKPDDSITSNGRGDVQLDGRLYPTKRYELHNITRNVHGEYD
jgi:hypothetical protein